MKKNSALIFFIKSFVYFLKRIKNYRRDKKDLRLHKQVFNIF